jgi:DNA processing protein
MERNKVVTGLAQVVIVAEADTRGGTWEGADGALKQKRPLYVRQPGPSSSLPGNAALIERGGHPLPWPTQALGDTFSPLLQESAVLHQQKNDLSERPNQLSLLAVQSTGNISADLH